MHSFGYVWDRTSEALPGSAGFGLKRCCSLFAGGHFASNAACSPSARGHSLILMHSLGDVWLCRRSLRLKRCCSPSARGHSLILMHSLGDVWLCRRSLRLKRCCSPSARGHSLILMHSLGDVWHPPSCSTFGAAPRLPFSLLFHYLTAFLG